MVVVACNLGAKPANAALCVGLQMKIFSFTQVYVGDVYCLVEKSPSGLWQDWKLFDTRGGPKVRGNFRYRVVHFNVFGGLRKQVEFCVRNEIEITP